MDAQQTELVRQLVSFKLAVKRGFQKNIDLELLVNDVEYARQCLSEVEDLAETEELLISVLHLRQRLLPAATPALATVGQSVPAVEAEVRQTRDYKFGARSW